MAMNTYRIYLKFDSVFYLQTCFWYLSHNSLQNLQFYMLLYKILNAYSAEIDEQNFV